MSEIFYKLTHEEFMELRKLRPSEKDVLLFLRTLTPFGDRPLNIGTKFIAEQLEISQRIVSRALKELDHLGLIEMELLSVSVTVNPFAKGHTSREDRQQCRPQDTNVAIKAQNPLPISFLQHLRLIRLIRQERERSKFQIF